MKRRNFLYGTGALATLAAAAALKPSDQGGGYGNYFSELNETLKNEGISHPRFLIDLDAMDANINQVIETIRSPKKVRLVVKSLPSIPLLNYVMARAGTRSLMGFHQPFLNLVASEIPSADVLMGKPLPLASAATFYKKLGNSKFMPERQLQWLIDTPERLAQYQNLAHTLGVKMRINLEIDIGLHRGGLDDTSALSSVLDTIANDPNHLEFSGFMGYEPHVVKLPGTLSNWNKARTRYREFFDSGLASHPQLFSAKLTLNTAGSPTYQLYKDDNFYNDISVGSGLIKPSDFDIPTLDEHVPASYIATPVLKKLNSTKLSGIEWAAKLFSLWNPNRQKAYFIYGGNWMANYTSPTGLTKNRLWGKSSNQEIVNASNQVKLEVDDFVFLRPTQSEAVMLQFGDVLTVRAGKIIDAWPIFQPNNV